jgi:hypothetical protein
MDKHKLDAVPLPPFTECDPNNDYVEALKDVLTRLWDGVSDFPLNREGHEKTWLKFICLCVESSGAYGLGTVIEERLAAAANAKVGSVYWESSNFDHWAELHGDFTPAQVQDGRRRFVLQLISEFS